MNYTLCNPQHERHGGRFRTRLVSTPTLCWLCWSASGAPAAGACQVQPAPLLPLVQVGPMFGPAVPRGASSQTPARKGGGVRRTQATSDTCCCCVCVCENSRWGLRGSQATSDTCCCSVCENIVAPENAPCTALGSGAVSQTCPWLHARPSTGDHRAGL